MASYPYGFDFASSRAELKLADVISSNITSFFFLLL